MRVGRLPDKKAVVLVKAIIPPIYRLDSYRDRRLMSIKITGVYLA